MKQGIFITGILFAVILTGCAGGLVPPTPQPRMGDRLAEKKSNDLQPEVTLSTIQLGRPAHHRTPIFVSLTVPNNCFRFVGGSIYSQGSGIVLRLAVMEGLHIGQTCSGPANIADVFSYPLAVQRGRAYKITVIVNNQLVGSLTSYAP